MTQRRIELWGEGFRWFDLKRLNMDLDRGPAPRPEVFPNGLIEYWNKDAMPKVVDPEASNYNMYGDVTGTDIVRPDIGIGNGLFLIRRLN